MKPRIVSMSRSAAGRKVGSTDTSSGDNEPQDRPGGAAARDFLEAGLPERRGQPGPGEGRRERRCPRIDRVALDDAAAPLPDMLDRGAQERNGDAAVTVIAVDVEAGDRPHRPLVDRGEDARVRE